MSSSASSESRRRAARQRFAHWLNEWRGPWKRSEVALLLLCPALLLATAFASERWRMQGHVLPRVELDGKPLQGMSVAAVEDELARHDERLKNSVITIKLNGTVIQLAGRVIDAGVDTERLLSSVMAEGRSGNLWAQVQWRWRRWFRPATIELGARFDHALWLEQLAFIEKSELETPREGGLAVEAGKLQRRDPLTGREVDREKASQLLHHALTKRTLQLELPLVERSPVTTKDALDIVERLANKLLSGPVALQVELPEDVESSNHKPQTKAAARPPETNPVVFTPEQLGRALRTRQSADDRRRLELYLDETALDELLEETRAQFEQPARNAEFNVSHGKITITPSRRQTRLHTKDAERRILDAALSESRRGVLKIVHAEQPKITTELAHTLGIDTLVSQFTTHHPCCRPRVENIHRIADLVNNAVVLPGETLSVNELVGPRSRANGFHEAPTIVHGKIRDTFGGGVSQFATTLFNAVLDGGYEIIERQPHSFYFPRYPVGHEATLSYPKPDLIFRNDTRSGLLIKTEYSGTYLRVKLYGNNDGRRVRREVSERFDFVEPKIEYIPNDELSPDSAKVRKRGERGFSVTVTRVVIDASGAERRESRKVTYEPRLRRVEIHSCKIPEGEKGYTGDDCPEPEPTDAGAPSP